MVSENEIIIAFLFKRSGKEKMVFSELYLNLSMDLKWFSPDNAKKFLNDAIKNGLLVKENQHILPNFDINKIRIPMGFVPTKAVFFEEKNKEFAKENNVLNQIIEKIIEKTNLKETEIIEKINKVSKEKNVTEEIAALIMGKEYEIEIKDFLKDLENKII